MKRLLPLLLFLLPIITIAQETQGWSKNLPQGFQVLATQDGHFMVLGSKKETAGEVETHTPYLARYTSEGQLVYERYYSRASATSMEATKMDLMSNGDLWVTGTARKADGSEHHLLSRINPATGDTLYMSLYPSHGDVVDFYLQTTPTGDRFYRVTLPSRGDIMAGNLIEITENFEAVKEVGAIVGVHFGRLHPYTSSTPDGYITIGDDYNGDLIKIGPEGNLAINEFYGRNVLAAPTPSGGAITLNLFKGQILNKDLELVSEMPFGSFNSSLPFSHVSKLKIAPNGFLVGGSYGPNMQTRAPFIFTLNNQGVLIWDKAYQHEEGSTLLDLAPTAEGGAVMLLGNEASIRLVKTGSQGDVLSTQEETALLNGRVSVYPNPANGNDITISFSAIFSGTLQLFDQTGRLWLEKTLNNSNSYQLDLPAELATGLYLIRLSAKNSQSFSIRSIKY